MEKRKAVEAEDGLEARRCGYTPLHPRPHRDKREGKGRGRGRQLGPPKPKPQPGLTPGRLGRVRAVEGGQPDRQLLAMNINYFLQQAGLCHVNCFLGTTDRLTDS